MTRAWNARLAALVALCGSLTLVGCASIKSTIYDPDTCCEHDKRRLHGIPVTMDVPAYVKVTITEKHYFYTDKDGKLVAAKTPPTRHMDYEVVTVKELFTVDFKRPAAGTMDLKLTYDDKTSGGQYFKTIAYDVEDLTIDKISGLIQAIISSTPTLAGLGLPIVTGDTGLIEVSRVVACEFFNARQPGLQARIQAFLERYVNACTQPCAGAACPVPVSPALSRVAPGPVSLPATATTPMPVAPTLASPVVPVATMPIAPSSTPPAAVLPVAPPAPLPPPMIVPANAAVSRLESLGRRQ